jgi:hypothetical protein
MGWYRIDPKTGKPLGQSKLSKPDVALLNALPGVDDDAAACYFGDGPWDMISVSVGILKKVAGKRAIPADDIRLLFAEEMVPPSLADLSDADCETILKEINALWKDLHDCYADDWDRGPNADEKKHLVEVAVEQYGN